MTYEQARARLAVLPTLEVKPGLERIRRLIDRLGSPQAVYPVVHVAGTNGKGSVVAMVDSVLRRTGLRTGRYTSPELVDFRDRIAVDGEWIGEETFADIVETMSASLDGDDAPTLFEALTAMAFEYFRRRRVDIAVVEVGLGGRFDATNVVRPCVTALTTVSLDHTALLGTTVERIAWEKAGIAKRGVPLILGSLPSKAEAVVRQVAREVSAPVRSCDVEPVRTAVDWAGATFRVEAADFPLRIELPLLGAWQTENLRVALCIVRELRSSGFAIPQQAIVDGLNGVRWPGRLETVHESPRVLLDGAHNVAGAAGLADEVCRLVPERARRALLFGVLRDKDAAGMLAALAPAFPSVTLCASQSPRALPAEALATVARAVGIRHRTTDSVTRGVRDALATLPPEDVLVVAGSLTVIAEARRTLTERE